jgi:hypothetical protein
MSMFNVEHGGVG